MTMQVRYSITSRVRLKRANPAATRAASMASKTNDTISRMPETLASANNLLRASFQLAGKNCMPTISGNPSASNTMLRRC